MPTEGIKIEKHFCKNLGLYFTDGFGSDGSVVKGLIMWHYLQTATWPKPELQPDRSSLCISNGYVKQTADVRSAAVC